MSASALSELTDRSLNECQTVLQAYITQHLPHAKATGVSLDGFSDTTGENTLDMSIPLSQNRNELGQGFGTSLYTLSHMACWSALYLKCSEHIEQPKILTRDAQIRYRHPVMSDRIVAHCRLPNPTQWKGFFAHYKNTGKTTLTLTSRIYNGKDIAVYFDGVFVLLGDETNR